MAAVAPTAAGPRPRRHRRPRGSNVSHKRTAEHDRNEQDEIVDTMAQLTMNSPQQGVLEAAGEISSGSESGAAPGEASVAPTTKARARRARHRTPRAGKEPPIISPAAAVRARPAHKPMGGYLLCNNLFNPDGSRKSVPRQHKKDTLESCTFCHSLEEQTAWNAEIGIELNLHPNATPTTPAASAGPPAIGKQGPQPPVVKPSTAATVGVEILKEQRRWQQEQVAVYKNSQAQEDDQDDPAPARPRRAGPGRTRAEGGRARTSRPQESAAAAAPPPPAPLRLATAPTDTSTSVEMARLQQSLQLRLDEQERRQELRGRVELLVRSLNHPGLDVARVHLFGSSANGFGSHSGDVDLCLEMQEPEDMGERKAAAQEIIRSMGRVLRKLPYAGMIKWILNARVPILQFRDKTTRLNVELCVGNLLAVHNTQLLWTYAAVDPRVRTLLYTIKHWAKIRDINDASRGTLSSYALAVMVIHYLQHGQAPEAPVLPCLQTIFPPTTPPGESPAPVMVDGFNAYFMRDLAVIRSQFNSTLNKVTTSVLLEGFFRYYCDKFDIGRDAVCIRGVTVTKEVKGWAEAPLAVEDPFELTHNLTKSVQGRAFRNVWNEFKRAADMASGPLRSLFED